MTDPGALQPALPTALQAALLARGETVGCAESLTGGQVAALLSDTPGASEVFVGGVVTYATALKRRLLGVTADRVVSGDCAVQMATGARDLLQADWAVATTGVAGPDEQEGQPVGTVFLGLAGHDTARFVRLDLSGDRAAIRAVASVGALDLLWSEVGGG